MRLHVVSDVHGNVDALARAGDGADALVVLGDLLDFVDYHDHSKGILGQVFGAEKVAVFAELRRGRHNASLIAYARSNNIVPPWTARVATVRMTTANR